LPRTYADEHVTVRIRHIAVLPHPGRWPGILARQAGMARASRQLGLDIRFTILCREDPREPDLEAVRLGALYRTSRCRAILGSGVLDDCDAAVLRYPTTAIDLAAGMLAGRHGARMVSEHHTDEVAEFRTMGPTGRLRAILASGQAVVLYRLAIMSKDGDWILREETEVRLCSSQPLLRITGASPARVICR